MILSSAMIPLLLGLQTPSYKTPLEAVDYFQQKRQKIGALYRVAIPNKADLDQAAAQLDEEFKLWQSPTMQYWARGEMRLLIKGRELAADRTIVAAKAVKREELVQWIQIATEQGSGSLLADVLEREPTMSMMLVEPNVRRALTRMRAITAWSQGLDFFSPAKDLYSGEEKIVALAIVWRHIDSHFPFGPRITDWNKTFVESIGKVGAAKNTFEVFTELQKFAATRQDGLTFVTMPFESSQQFEARAVVSTRQIEDKVVISEIDSQVAALPIQFGDEVLAIDGVPVQNYAELTRRPTVSASTPQGLAASLYGPHLLAGELGKPFRISLRHAGGKTDEVSLTRILPNLKGAPASLEVFKTKAEVAILQVKNLDSLSILQALEANEKLISDAKGIVVDLRECKGGLRFVAQAFSQHFQSAPFQWLKESTRVTNSSYSARGVEWSEATLEPDNVAVAAKGYTTQPLVILVSARTSGPAEELAEVLASTKRGVLVGQATAGNAGLSFKTVVPGGGTVSVLATKVFRADGQPLNGLGVTPTVPVTESLSAFRSRVDEGLEAALKQFPIK